MFNKSFCNNCGNYGHLYHQCKIPIISIGVILFRKGENNNLQYLMICRKDTLGYVDFIRGKYNINNKNYILNIIDEMTIHEKKRIITKSFEELWNELWGDFDTQNKYIDEKEKSFEKFQMLKNGITYNKKIYTLIDFINESKTSWNEPEWGFPKGRRNHLEKDIFCAIREFEEETGIDNNKISIISNIVPYEEIFIGSNYKAYNHKYYIATIKNNDESIEKYQKSEVSNMKWFDLSTCLNKIRDYNLEKKKIIINLNKTLEEYSIY